MSLHRSQLLATSEQLETLVPVPESQHLALTVVYVPHSFDSGTLRHFTHRVEG
jgi:hypothetical protein